MSAARTSSSSCLKDGRVKDFKLNTQCSAGNGYFLQSTAEGFGKKVEEFADIAFSAKSMPSFGYGCAVFMQSDIVNFQRQGWRSEEILAGLADVLPKNVFLYVASIPNLASLGTRFRSAGRHAEQPGGGQGRGGLHQVKLPRQRQRAGDHRPRALRRIGSDRRGAGSAAAVAQRQDRPPSSASMRCANIRYRTTRNEDTRCYFCKNNCLRTFIDVDVTGGQRCQGLTTLRPSRMNVPATAEAICRSGHAIFPVSSRSRPIFPPPDTVLPAAQATITTAGAAAAAQRKSPLSAPRSNRSSRFRLRPERRSRSSWRSQPCEFQPRKTKVPLRVGEQRLIIATCEKGAVEDLTDMKDIKADIDKIKAANPNFVDIAAREVFRHREVSLRRRCRFPAPRDSSSRRRSKSAPR